MAQSQSDLLGLGQPRSRLQCRQPDPEITYSDCVLALDADTGKLKWYFQFTPHDELDYDSVQVPVLTDLDWQGQPRKVMLWANRNGFFYVLDRVNGQFLSGKPFVKVTWASGLDEKGRPMKVANMSPTTDGTAIYPGVQGGTNWYSPSYSPRTGLFYVQSWVNTGTLFTKFPVEYEAGKRYSGGTPRLIGNPGRGETTSPMMEESYGAVRAIDPKTGDRKWEFKMNGVTQSGVLSTASGLVFTGSRDGSFFALDATTGAELWRATVGGPVNSSPMTYSVGGKQYIAIAAGSALFAFALPE